MNVFWRDLAGLHCCHWLISEDLIPQTKVNKTKESADAYCSWHNLQRDAFMVIINENNCFFYLLFGGTEQISIVHCSRLHRYRIFYPQTLSPDTFRNSELSGVWIYTAIWYIKSIVGKGNISTVNIVNTHGDLGKFRREMISLLIFSVTNGVR